MGKITEKILKAFGLFIIVIVLIGFFTLSIYRNTLCAVQCSSIGQEKTINSQYEFIGMVKPKNYIEIYAERDLTLVDTKIKNTQIVENEAMFTLQSKEGDVLDISAIKILSQNQEDVEYIVINDNNELQVSKKICIDYITESTDIRVGELIARYYYYEENLIIESRIDRNLFNYIKTNKPEMKFKGNVTLSLSIDDYDEFTQYCLLNLKIQNAPDVILTPFETVTLVTDEKVDCDLVVSKSLFLSRGQIELDCTGVIYYITEVDTVFGKQYALAEQECIICGINDYDIGLKIDDKNSYSDMAKGVVFLPTTELKDGMKVRIK